MTGPMSTLMLVHQISRPSQNRKCDTWNAATNQNCQDLIEELNKNSLVQVDQRTRALCYASKIAAGAAGWADQVEACCVAWRTEVRGRLNKGDLIQSADNSKEPASTYMWSLVVAEIRLPRYRIEEHRNSVRRLDRSRI